jgi:hypothetical protein
MCFMEALSASVVHSTGHVPGITVAPDGHVIRGANDTAADVVVLIGLVWLLPIVILLTGLPVVMLVRLIAAAVRLLFR